MTQMHLDAVELTRDECLSFLAGAPLGRLVLTHAALPVVVPVTFVLLPEGVVICTREGGLVHTALSRPGTVVAFEADDVDAVRHSGWMVTVVGPGRVVTDATEGKALARLPVEPWAPGGRNVLVLVELGLVDGRRVGGPGAVPHPEGPGAAPAPPGLR